MRKEGPQQDSQKAGALAGGCSGQGAEVCATSPAFLPPRRPPDEIPDVYIVERLFSSSLVVVVSHTKPRQMNVYHFKKGTEICNYSYSSNILSIRLNRQVSGGGSPGLPLVGSEKTDEYPS